VIYDQAIYFAQRASANETRQGFYPKRNKKTIALAASAARYTATRPKYDSFLGPIIAN